MQDKTRTTFRTFIKLTLCAIAALWLGPATAGSLDPPASAVDSSGNPVPTGLAPSSWDRKLASTNGSTAAGRVGCDSQRFTCIFGDTAVRDNETNLVWDRDPGSVQITNTNVVAHCADREVGGRKGWQLPTREQLASLIDTSNTNRALPTSHPFILPPPDSVNIDYWFSSSFDTSVTSGRWFINLALGEVRDPFSINSGARLWCVRSGKSFDSPVPKP